MLTRCALTLSFLAAPALAFSPKRPVPEQVEVVYRCDGGVLVPVVFINPPNSDAGYASAVIEGRMVVLTLATSGEGVRYVSDRPGKGYQIRVQGDAAEISADPAGQNRPVVTGCRLQR